MRSFRNLAFDRACEAMGDEIVAGWALDGDSELLSFAPPWLWWIRKQWGSIRQSFWDLFWTWENKG